MQKHNSDFRMLLIGISFTLITNTLFAQSEFNGNIILDSTWNPVIYLSLIPTFDQLNSMSNQMIIESSELDIHGNFSFSTEYLPAGNNIYRIHLSKKGDPPASLIIGGKDENHMFVVANKESSISIKSTDSNTLFGNVQIEKSPQSQLLKEIDKMVLYVDTANFNSSSLKRELMENALDEKLRQFADSCSFPLVALYAIYKSNFESHIETNPDFYIRFLEKWQNEKSPYFEEFRKKLPIVSGQKSYSVLYILLGLSIGASLMFVFMKKRFSKPQNLFNELTLQERKIFKLLHEGNTNKEISDELNISLSTVKSHVNSIFSKLNIKSRREVLSFEY